MRSSWCWFAASLLLGGVPLRGATVERAIRHQVGADGRVLETTRLRVRLDAEADLRRWASHDLLLDSNRELIDVEAEAVRPDGRRIKVPKRRHDQLTAGSFGVLHSSQVLYEIAFPRLPLGSELRIETVVRVEPYFPAGVVSLALADETTRLEVEVAGEGLRYLLEGDGDGLVLEAGPQRLALRADHLPAAGDDPPALRYAWGEPSSWAGVASWYEAILEPVPRREASVREVARRLTAGIDDPRGRLERLLGHLRREVRYVAVEVGIGGYRPTPAAETLSRGWGDCKDKSLLLIDLLAEVGLPAYPALIRSSLDDDIDPAFPAPQFNHLIVAVDTAGLATGEGDPVAAGLLFVDPTQERGGARWLNQAVQGKSALVVRGEGSGLVTTPRRPGDESRRLAVDLELAADGSGTGSLLLTATGHSAVALREGLLGSDAVAAAREVLGELLPGAEVSDPRWGGSDDAVPRVELRAAVRWPVLSQAAAQGRSLRLPDPAVLPSSRELARGDVPGVWPGRYETAWRLSAPPEWCPQTPPEVAVDNGAGRFLQTASLTDGAVQVERRLELAPPSSGEDLAGALAAISVAEHQAHDRRLRFACEDEPAALPP